MLVDTSLKKSGALALALPNRRILQLAVGRVLAVLFLLAATSYWSGAAFPDEFADFSRAPLLIFVVWLIAAAFFLALSFWRARLHLQIAAQLALDALLITWLIWATGDVRSPYITLYTVVICLTGVFFRANETLFAATASTFVFTVLSTLVVFGILPRFSNLGADVSAQQAFQIIGFHDVAFLVVGLLAAQLAVRQRRSHDELEETAQSLVNLRRLHERIVQSVRSGLVTTDLDGKIYIFNYAAAEITGFKPEEMEGRTIFDLLGNIRRQIRETLGTIKKGEPPPRYEIEFVTAQNFPIWLGYNISPLFADSGEISGLVITFQDLTEIRLMEDSVRRKDRLAAVGRVAAGLAHEIRNPLGAMRGAIQVLNSSFDKQSSQAQLMEIVMRESDRLNAIITNFLTYARPRSGEFETTDLAQVLREAVTLLRHSPDVRKHHEIVEDLPAQAVYSNADAVGLKQVFWNLTRNAIQAMPDGGKLTVKLEQTASSRAQIAFVDSGVGMPPAQVERLFEPFSQSTTGGTGLGLSIVYQIIRDHSGTINVRSQQGKGTTITIELPAESAHQTVA